MRASFLLLCSWLLMLVALAAADGADHTVDYGGRSLLGASGCNCGCLIRNPFSGGCSQCKPCPLADTQKKAGDVVATVRKNVDKFGTNLNKAGAIVDEARAAYTDPSGYIRKAIVNNDPNALIAKALARVRRLASRATGPPRGLWC
jgi:hypothetical protein